MNPEIVKKAIYYFLGAWLAISAALPYAVYNLSDFIEENNTPVAEASSHNMMLFWAGGSAPSGWTIISDGIGEDFTNVMPRGADTYGGTGGSDNHTHTVTYDSETQGNANPADSGGTAVSSAGHTHGGFSSSSTSSETLLPPYSTLKVIEYTNSTGEPSTIPAGAIAMFESTGDIPSGWSQYNGANGDHIRTTPSAGNSGGSSTHSHTTNYTLSDGSEAEGAANGATNPTTFTSVTHSHSGQGTTDGPNHEPPSIEVVLADPDSGASIPTDMIAMWDGSPPSNWTKNSGTSGDFNGNFFKAVSSTSFPTTGGSSSHSHAQDSITSGAPSNTNQTLCDMCRLGIATDSHTHDVTVSYDSQNNLPSYIDVITAKRTSGGPSCPLGVTAPGDISQPTGEPGETTTYNWGSGEQVTVTDGGSGWTLTVTSTDLDDGSGNSIPQADVFLATDGTLGEFPTLITGSTSNVSETAAGDHALDGTQQVARRNSGTSCDETDHQLTTKVDIPVDTSATSTYTGTLTLTVS